MSRSFLAGVVLFSVGLSGLLLGCRSQAPPDTRATDEQAIRQASDVDWLNAARAKDVERVLSFYAADAAVLPPNTPMVSGKKAIRATWSKFVGTPGFAINWQTSRVEIARAGDLAYQLATFEVSVTDPRGKPVTDRGKYIAVWKKQPDATWKVVADIWNSDLPAPAPLKP